MNLGQVVGELLKRSAKVPGYKGIGTSQRVVLAYLRANPDVACTVTLVAHELGMRTQHVSHRLRTLVDRGFATRAGKRHSYTYQFKARSVLQ